MHNMWNVVFEIQNDCSKIICFHPYISFIDTEEAVIRSDDSNISWVVDAVDGTMDSMEQLELTFCVDAVAEGTFNSLSREEEEIDNIGTLIKRSEGVTDNCFISLSRISIFSLFVFVG